MFWKSLANRLDSVSRAGVRIALLWCGALCLASCGAPEVAAPNGAATAEPQADSKGESNNKSPPARSKQQRGAAQNNAQPLDLQGVSFVDVAQERGLVYTWPQQPRPMTALDAFGAGCAAFDADDDGWQDVLLVGDPHPALFRNPGQGRFENVTADSGLDAANGDWAGCAVGDYNGDGRLDLLLTGYHNVALYQNVGGLRFELATSDAGLDPDNDGLWGTSAGFMDLDGDGWLDLVLLNYVVFGPSSQQYCEYTPGVRSGCNPKIYPPERGRIYRNTGAGGFELVAESRGMNQTRGIALVLAFIDLDRDGRFDFYVGNDGIPSDFLHNLGEMQFENRARVVGLETDDDARAISSMGADWADFNRDGALDLAVSNFQGLSYVVFRNLGQGSFVDASKGTRLARSTRNRLGFGSKWLDFENDGWPDLSFVNGHVYDNAAEVEGAGVGFRQPQFLFSNRGGQHFVDLVPALGTDVQRPLVGRGSATADFDNDGRVDLLVVDFEGPVMLLENRSVSQNHWLKIELRAPPPNVLAYGARLIGRAGDRIWVSELSPASSYLSSSDPRIHWGLGNAPRLESLTIRWPWGTELTLENVAADRILRIEAPR